VTPLPAAVATQFEALDVSRESSAEIQKFVELLLQWQNKINLISPATKDEIWTRHVLDSLQLIPLLPAGATHIADLGSGSGFPGLPLAIASGKMVDLYESNNKKAAFLREALRITKARGAVHVIRLDPAVKLPRATMAQVVTARALAPLRELLGLAEPFLAGGAIGLFHKGREVEAELREAAKFWKFSYNSHVSSTDSKAVILTVKEVSRV
jgi:16S rRNA (guanine527-N7)-methyltransferase